MAAETDSSICLADDLSRGSLLRFRSRIAHPVLQALFDYWLELHPGNGLPSRAEIDPSRIPRSALASTMLLDVERQETKQSVVRLRFRLVGTAVVELREGMVPRDPTGRYVDQVEFREGPEGPNRFYSTVAISGRPGFQTLTYGPRHPRFRGIYHRLALPLSEDGIHANMLLAGFSRAPSPKN